MKKRYCVYGKTYNDCLNKCRQKHKILINQKTDIYNQNDNALKKWVEYYIDNIKKPQLKESSYVVFYELYERHLKKHKIINRDVSKITTINLQDFINNILSKSAKKRMYHLLNETFAMLQKMAITKVNPMAVVIIPKEKEEISDFDNQSLKNKILNYTEEKMLLNVIKNSQCYHAAKFILYTGLRRGECIGLCWKHINFEKKTIIVNQQWNEQTKKLTTTKSKAGNRIIPILPQALEILNELKKNMSFQDDFIFKGINRLTQQLVFYSNKLPFKVNPHMLRHTFASRCYFAGLDPKIIQTLLGHESMKTTLDTYTHIIDFEDEMIIKKIRDFFISINMIN